MCDREIILGIEAVCDQRVDVIYVELPFVQYQVNRIVADEAATSLTIEQLLFKPKPLLCIQA